MEIECGDLILFDRPCSLMQPFSSIVCSLAKSGLGSEYDHIGLVIENPRSGILHLLEANANGVTLHILKDRLIKTSSTKIAIRKLHGKTLNKELKTEMYNHAKLYVGKKYNTSSIDMTLAGLSSYTSHSNNHFISRKKQALIHALETYQKRLSGHTSYPSTILNSLNSRIDQLKVITNTDSKHSTHQASSQPEVLIQDRYFCSQLISDILTKCGILYHYKDNNQYVPADFSSTSLLHNLVLSPEYHYSPNIVVLNPKKLMSKLINHSNLPQKLKVVLPLECIASHTTDTTSSGSDDSGSGGITYHFTPDQVLPSSAFPSTTTTHHHSLHPTSYIHYTAHISSPTSMHTSVSSGGFDPHRYERHLIAAEHHRDLPVYHIASSAGGYIHHFSPPLSLSISTTIPTAKPQFTPTHASPKLSLLGHNSDHNLYTVMKGVSIPLSPDYLTILLTGEASLSSSHYQHHTSSNTPSTTSSFHSSAISSVPSTMATGPCILNPDIILPSHHHRLTSTARARHAHPHSGRQQLQVVSADSMILQISRLALTISVL